MPVSTTRIAFVVVLAVLLFAFGYMVLPFFTPAFFAMILAIIFNPLQKFLQDRFGGRRHIAATLTTIVVVAVILIPLSLIIMVVVSQLVDFAQTLSTRLQTGQLSHAIDGFGERLNFFISNITQAPPPEYNIKGALTAFLKDASEFLYRHSPRMFTTTLSFIVQTILMIVFMFGLFAEGTRLYDLVMELSPLSASHKNIFAKEIRGMINATLAGMFVTALVQGVLMGIGFAVAGISQAVMWGVVSVIMAFIPIIGAASVYLGAFIVLMLLGETTTAVGILIYGIVFISSIDNIVKPLVMREKARIHPILLLVGLLGGIRLFGPVGLIFGPVLLAVFLAALRIYRREFLPGAAA